MLEIPHRLYQLKQLISKLKLFLIINSLNRVQKESKCILDMSFLLRESLQLILYKNHGESSLLKRRILTSLRHYEKEEHKV